MVPRKFHIFHRNLFNHGYYLDPLHLSRFDNGSCYAPLLSLLDSNLPPSFQPYLQVSWSQTGSLDLLVRNYSPLLIKHDLLWQPQLFASINLNAFQFALNLPNS